MKKYDKLLNKGFKVEDFQNLGLVVQEKLDGSNASFTIGENHLIEAFSRKTKLNWQKNTLNGFLGWVEDFVNNNQSVELYELLEDNIIFGEWLVKHKVQYKPEAYRQFYVFDIYNKETGVYLDPMETQRLAEKFGLKTVKYFVKFEPSHFKSMSAKEIDNEIREYIGKSDLTEDGLHGEGIVVKINFNRHENYPCYKIVTDTFKEFSKRKMNNERKSNNSVADYAITKARMEKQIFKAIDENKLTKEDLVIENFGKIIKEVGQNFVDDIFEEEMEQMKKVIEKQIKKKMPVLLREILMEE